MLISNADAVELYTVTKLLAPVKMDRQATWNMAKNSRILKGMVGDVEEARSTLIKQHDSTGTGTIKSESPDWIPFITGLQVVMNMRLEVPLLSIPAEKLPMDEIDRLLTDDKDPVKTQMLKGVFSILVEE